MEKKKSGGDFRYAVGDAKVPWHAVGEFYRADDVLEVVKFLLPCGDDEQEWQNKVNTVAAALRDLGNSANVATKLTLGKKVAEAEEICKDYFRSPYACLLTNWTAGMEIAYKMVGLKAGDEVIMPAVTFIATMAYPLSVGAKIVFADVDPETINLDPADVARKITPKTKMIVPVHLGGYPVDMDPIMELAKKYGIYVMEDAAHGMGGMYKGKRLGAIGDFGGFSLHEVKNITSFGEGGLLLTKHEKVGKQLGGARFLGLDFSRKIKDWLYDISPLETLDGSIAVAGNHSASEMSAVGLLLQMKRLDAIIAERRKAAEYMNSVLSQEPGILVEKSDTSDTYGTHHLYLLRIDPEVCNGDIQELSQRLKDKGLTNITHFGPMYRFRIMKELGYDENAIAATCPVTEKMFYKSYTHLPLYPLTREQLEYQARAVVEAVREMKNK